MKKERLFYLDFIRCISFLLIFFYHFQVQGIVSHVSNSQLFYLEPMNGTLGNLGVSLFFLISGAALMYTYEESFSLKQYFKKRFLALLPMFWIAYIIVFIRFDCIANNPFSSKSPFHMIWTLIGMDGYLNDVVPTFYRIGEWFLGCIILLYLLFPLLRKMLLKFPRLFPIILLALYIPGIAFYNLPIYADRFFLFRIIDIVVGMYLIHFRKKVTLPVAIVCLCVNVVFFYFTISAPLVLRMQVWGCAFFLLLIYISQWIKETSIKKGITFIGNLSYPAFLVHHVIMTQLLNQFSNCELSGIDSLLLLLYTFLITMCFAFCLQQITKKILSILPFK